MDKRTLDAKVMLGAGGLLSSLAAVFLWRDLQVPPEVLVAVAAVGAALLATVRTRRWPLAGPALLGATAVVGGGWYAVTREPVLLWGLGVSWLANLVVVLRTGAAFRPREEPLRGLLTWFGLAVATLVTSAAFYFEFLTLDLLRDDVARRLILTLAWLAVGVGLVHYARRREEPLIRDAGFLFLAASVGKAMLYDTTHLAGLLRVTVLAACGAVLLLAGALAFRRPSPERS